MSTTTVSAPGKVLIAGGYLVLDPGYSGVVVSTSSRFYTSISSSGDNTNTTPTILVRSPQFENATWLYQVDFASAGSGVVGVSPDPNNNSKNKFVQLALEKTLGLAAEVKGQDSVQAALGSAGLEIVIAGDNDFYSQSGQLAELNLPRSFVSLDKLKPFAPTGVTLSNVHKTGLGSSAALITSLVSALLIHLNVIEPSSFTPGTPQAGSRLAHNLAQYVHCLAQGKIGSGFDVSAAIFGSHLYRRFDPAVLAPAMEANQSIPLLPVVSSDNQEWTYQVQPFRLPPFTRIVLADVDAGSDTPSLVSKVLKWRKENPEEANGLWTSLDQDNQTLAKTLLHLSELHDQNPKSYESIAKYLSSTQSVQWLPHHGIPPEECAIMDAFSKVHDLSESIREHMRDMGSRCDVPIEPPEQTQLLDACISLAGVIAGGVPGAGGYDAIWLLILDPTNLTPPDEPPIARVDRVWSRYTDLTVTPLAAKESLNAGVRVEKEPPC